MRKTIIYLLSFSIVIILSGCASQEISVNKTEDSIVTGNLEIITGNISTDDEVYDNYAPVPSLDQTKFGQEWKSDQWFVVNDKVWKGNYYENRNWILLGSMGVQSADIMYGYINGSLYLDLGASIVKFQVDQNSYISYYSQLKNPNYTGTGEMNIQDKRGLYKSCKDSLSMEQKKILYDREKYEALLEKNPMRCFGEDKTYLYGRREYKKSVEGGYELMRIKK